MPKMTNSVGPRQDAATSPVATSVPVVASADGLSLPETIRDHAARRS
jgi:hypothetical protein